jgi:carboxyl-terminal processing protease
MKLNTIHSQFCAAVAFLAVAARATPWPRGTATRLSPPNDHVRGLRSKPSTLQKDFMVRGLNDERQVEFPDGVWTSRGYGYVLEANSTTYNIFEETEISCIPTNPTLIQYVLGVELENNNQTAIVDVAGAAAKYVFDETGDFQSGCADGLTPVMGDDNYVHDALRVFDIFAQTFVEHYAFFELRGIDWAALTEDARSKLTGNSTDAELTEALISVLEPLHDYHVSLVTDQVEYHSKPLEIIVQLQQEFVQQDAIDDFENYLNVQLGTWIMTLSSYLDDKILKGTPGEFSWGTATNGTVGYMQLMSMGPEDEVAFADALDQAIVDLQDTHTMIVDVRVNGGGDDLVSLEIASHFTSERFLAFSKRAVNGDDFTQATEVYVEPKSKFGKKEKKSEKKVFSELSIYFDPSKL